MVKACIVIPVYNHHLKIVDIVNRLTSQSIHCFLLDDGSDTPCKDTLLTLQNESRVTLVRWEQNRGKGAVVCDGFKMAFDQGFTHALQIDADGQHDLKDVPVMLKRAKEYPHCVISANRAYEQMPKSRRRGRLVTDIWVWINTLSPQIKDSMCGFRLYPLAETMKLIENHHVGRHMDFDTDIIVRLYWMGLDVEHVPTQIFYDTEIASHFDMFKDNVRISYMHTKLFFGMLPRIPRLLARHLKGKPC